MSADPKIIARAKDKALYKVRGVLVNYRMVNEKLMEFIIRKGTGKNERFFAFKCWEGEIAHKIKNSASKARFLVKFKIESKPWNGRWNTDLWANYIEDWPVNADAELRAARKAAIDKNTTARISENEKNLSLFGRETDF